MIPFAVPDLLTAARHAPVMWAVDFQPRVSAWYARSDRMIWNSKMGVHEASVALQCAGLMGWKL